MRILITKTENNHISQNSRTCSLGMPARAIIELSTLKKNKAKAKREKFLAIKSLRLV